MPATTSLSTQVTIAALKDAVSGGLITLDTKRFGRVSCGVSHVANLFNDAYAVIWFYVDGVRQLERVYASKVRVVAE